MTFPDPPQPPATAASLLDQAEAAHGAGRHREVLAIAEQGLADAALTPEARAILLCHGARAALELRDVRRAQAWLLEAAGLGTPVPPWAGSTLIGACRKVPFKPGTRLPPLVAATLDRFHETILHVLRAEAPPAPIAPPPGLPLGVVGFLWLDLRTKLIDTRGLSAEARALLAERHGLSPRFLDLAQQGHAAVSAECYRLSDDLAFAARTEVSPRIRDIAAAVRLGGKPLLCPFTGQRALSRDTIAYDLFRHSRDGRAALVMYGLDIMDVAGDATWLLPAEGLLLTAMPHVRLRRDLAAALARLASDPERMLRGFARPDRAVAIAESRLLHVGHDLWNQLSGWSRLLSLIAPEEIGLVSLVPAEGQLYGPVTGLYPEIGAALRGRIRREGASRELLGTATDEGFLLFNLLDDYVTEDLAGRVQAWARSSCRPEFLQGLAVLRQEAAPMLMVTLRLGNRAWAEQEAGLISLLRTLGEEFPGLVAVLDGLNAFNHRSGSHRLMSMEPELAMAARIVAGVGDKARMINTIGCPLPESLMYCEAVDAYVAPIGAGMAKVRWVANKPGVAYSNTTMLAPGHLDGWLYDNPRYREAPVQARRIPREAVTDIPFDSKWGSMRDNYSFDWRELHTALAALLR